MAALPLRSAAAAAAATQALDWRQRPSSLQHRVTHAFDAVSKVPQRWGLYNGSTTYGLCSVNETTLVKAIIEEAPVAQTDFYFLDIGAGDFSWGESLAASLQGVLLRRGVFIHIIGIRGEPYPIEQERRRMGPIHLYNLGNFKVEELQEEFRKRGIVLEGNVDFVVSRWCLRHLADPLGTWLQAYHLLRPGRGLFAFDGFFFRVEGDSETPQLSLANFLLETGAPFLQYNDNHARNLNQYILRRPDDRPCEVQMTYTGADDISEAQVGSRCVTRFTRKKTTIWTLCGKTETIGRRYLFGDPVLFDALKARNLFNEHSYERAVALGSPRVFWAPFKLGRVNPRDLGEDLGEFKHPEEKKRSR